MFVPSALLYHGENQEKNEFGSKIINGSKLIA